MNGYGKLRRCAEKHHPVVDFSLFLALAVVVLRQLIHHACTPLPLGHPSHYPLPQVIPIAGRS